MGSVIQLKNKVNNAYLDLKNSVDDKIVLVEEKIKNTIENNNTTIYTPSISLSFRTLGGHLVEIFKNPILLW